MSSAPAGSVDSAAATTSEVAAGAKSATPASDREAGVATLSVHHSGTDAQTCADEITVGVRGAFEPSTTTISGWDQRHDETHPPAQHHCWPRVWTAGTLERTGCSGHRGRDLSSISNPTSTTRSSCSKPTHTAKEIEAVAGMPVEDLIRPLGRGLITWKVARNWVRSAALCR